MNKIKIHKLILYGYSTMEITNVKKMSKTLILRTDIVESGFYRHDYTDQIKNNMYDKYESHMKWLKNHHENTIVGKDMMIAKIKVIMADGCKNEIKKKNGINADEIRNEWVTNTKIYVMLLNGLNGAELQTKYDEIVRELYGLKIYL